MENVAILLDGGFVKKSFKKSLKRFPQPSDVVALCHNLMNGGVLTVVPNARLYRIFFYDAEPFTGTAVNPLDGQKIYFQNTPEAKQNQALLQKLDLQPHFAIRRGVLMLHGWKLGKRALQALSKNQGKASKPLAAKDIVPNLQQKGVDTKIGLDIASLAIKRLVTAVVLVTGDSDMIPAMKLARREGLMVYLHTMQNPVHSNLKVHADIVLP